MFRISQHKRGQRGAVLIWFALFLLITLGFVALGIDIAKLAATRTQLQNAADAAALAGVSAINPATGTLQQDLAISRAQFTASQNKAFIDVPQSVILAASDVEFPASNEVRVTVRREGANAMVTTFAQVLGLPRLEMTASATAIADTARSVGCGIVPLGVTPEPGQDFQVGCTPGYILKFGSGTGSNGNYGPLDFPTCDDGPCAGRPVTGASTFECLMKNGYCCTISKDQNLSTEPGNMSGPFRKAIYARFSADKDQREGICYSQYRGTGQRVIIVPLTTDAGPGHTSVTVTGFGAFFIKDRPGSGNDNGLVGEFIYAVVPGGSGDGSGSGAVAYSLRLIQ
jgi:Flp pilus assembly protein TadG